MTICEKTAFSAPASQELCGSGGFALLLDNSPPGKVAPLPGNTGNRSRDASEIWRSSITRKILAVDGSFFTVAPRIAWAVFNGSGKGNVRLHVQFNVLLGLPEQVSLTNGRATESGQLRQQPASNCLYIADRGFQDDQLFADILHADSDFVIRLRKSASSQTIEELPLSAADVADGVHKDTRVQLGWRGDQTHPLLRRVEVAVAHREGGSETLILLTNRFDLPAHIIALLYQYRWQVELFFRWLKCTAHFKHFFPNHRRA